MARRLIIAAACALAVAYAAGICAAAAVLRPPTDPREDQP